MEPDQFSLTSIPNTVDILINNAGIGFVGNIEQTEEADFDRLYQVNVKEYSIVLRPFYLE